MHLPLHRHNGAGKNGLYGWPTEPKQKRAASSRLCEPCANDDHTTQHEVIGCVRVIEGERICTCTVKGRRR